MYDFTDPLTVKLVRNEKQKLMKASGLDGDLPTTTAFEARECQYVTTASGVREADYDSKANLPSPISSQ